jgi:hypothetical protein
MKTHVGKLCYRCIKWAVTLCVKCGKPICEDHLMAYPGEQPLCYPNGCYEEVFP